MKIDCTKCLVLFFILLLVHVVARTDELYGWYTKYSQQLLFILRCKKNKENQRHCCNHCLLPIMNAQIKHL